MNSYIYTNSTNLCLPSVIELSRTNLKNSTFIAHASSILSFILKHVSFKSL